MALGKPTSWLRRKNIPQVGQKSAGQKFSFGKKKVQVHLKVRRLLCGIC
jgi:hypothetical protein